MLCVVSPFPPLPEQEAIAAFLDRETAKIDALVEKQRRMLNLLKEKRTALISHAVTKGLNPDAKLKDSGVAWLGMVPEGWEVKRLKEIVLQPITDGPHETPEFIDDGVPFVSAEALATGIINFEKIRGYISGELHKKFCLKYKPKYNDIYLIKSGATTGKSAIVKTDIEFNIWSPLAAIRCNPEIALPDYILNYLRSKEFLSGIELFWSFGTQQNIGMGVIENLHLPLPPVSEQKAIAAFLDRETAKIDTLAARIEDMIAKLQEYRTALITATVTGKVDVRTAEETP